MLSGFVTHSPSTQVHRGNIAVSSARTGDGYPDDAIGSNRDKGELSFPQDI